MADKKPCVLCGKLFESCDKCDKHALEYKVRYGGEPWRTVCDSAQCFQIYEIIRQYNFEYIDIATAKARLSRIPDMPDLSLRPATQAVVTKIMGYIPETTKAPKAQQSAQNTDAKPQQKIEPRKFDKKSDKTAK